MKAKEYYALVKEGIEAGTATALKGAVNSGIFATQKFLKPSRMMGEYP